MEMKLTLFVFLLLPWYISCDSVVVSTRFGKIKGYTRNFDRSLGLGNVSLVNIFLGIPYASPPVGDLRFRPPVKPKPWKGIYDATKFKAMCYQDPQYNTMFWEKDFKWPQSDDCLYINIYAPNTSHSVSYPVMVYIHGGGYEAGSPVISPGDILPLWDVVLVTIQYRLGPFGFISTGDSEAPGNYGMLDQIEVLSWIKDNIKVFKGDPSKVTIFGESAGGSSVGLLLLSPLSKGLFHSAIPLSGIDFSPFAVNTKSQALNQTNKTAKSLQCPQLPNSKKLIDCLRKVEANDIFYATFDDSNVWRPVVDGIFLHDTPRNLRERGQFHAYPMLVGITQDEGAYFLLNYTSLNVTPFLPTAAHYYEMFVSIFERPNVPLNTSALIKEAIAFQYTPWPDIENEGKLKKALMDMLSDYNFNAPAHAVLEYHSPVAPTYMFVFSHRSNLSSSPWWKGAPHKEDTPYQFGFPLMDISAIQEYDEQDRNVSQIMITLMTNFARTSNPTPQPVRGCTLNRFTPTDHSYLNITTQPSINSNFHGSNVAFWNKYFPKLVKISESCKQSKAVLGSTSTASTTLCSIIPLLALLPLNLGLF